MKGSTQNLQTQHIYPWSEKIPFDEKLKWSCEDFRTRLKTVECAGGRTHPDALTLARIAHAAYKTKDECQVRDNLPEGWELLTTGRNEESWPRVNGYYGVATWNPSQRCVVIAHKGTKNSKDLWTDLQGVIKNKWVAQATSAITFTHQVVNRISQMVGDDFEIFVTGHSLGGWLSQITTYTIQFCAPQSKHKSQSKQMFEFGCEKWKPHCVAFDPPGCKERLETLKKQLEPSQCRGDTLRELHITSFVTMPHLVNCCGSHCGQLIRVFNKEDTLPKVHSIKIFIEELKKLNNKQDRTNENELREVRDWPKMKNPVKLGEAVKTFFGRSVSEKSMKLMRPRLESEEGDGMLYTKTPYQTIEFISNAIHINALNKAERKFLRNYTIHFHLQGTLTKAKDDKFLKECDQMLLKFKFTNDDYLVCEEPVTVQKFVPCIRKLLRDHPMYLLDMLTALNRSKMNSEFKFQKEIVSHDTDPRTMQYKCTDTQMTSVRMLDELLGRGQSVYLLQQTELKPTLLELMGGGAVLQEKDTSNYDSKSVKYFIVVMELNNPLTREQCKLIDNLMSANIVLLLISIDQVVNPFYKSRSGKYWFQTSELNEIEDRLKWEELHIDTQNDLLNAKIVQFKGSSRKLSFKDITKMEGLSALAGVMTIELLRNIQMKGRKESFTLKLEVGERSEKREFKHIQRCFEKTQTGCRGDAEQGAEITEKKLLNDHNGKVTIISGSHGMGTTETLRYLCEKLEKKHPKSWVIHISLLHCADILETNKYSFKEDGEVVRFLIHCLLKKGGFIEEKRELLEYCLAHDTETFVLIDGFGEIIEKFNKEAMELLAALKKTKVKRVFVTTRNHLVTELEEKLSLPSFALKRFSKENFNKYVNGQGVDGNRLRIALENVPDICYNPLLLQIMSIYLAKLGHLENNVNLTGLYHFIVRRVHDLYVMRYFSPSGGIDYISKLTQIRTVKKLKNLAVRLKLPDNVDLLINIEENDLQELFLIGLVEKLGQDGKFTHSSFQDFFVAERILETLPQEIAAAMCELVEESFSTVLYFMTHGREPM